jgi:hypothetical protein
VPAKIGGIALHRHGGNSEKLFVVTENHGVGGSIPPLGTILFKDLGRVFGEACRVRVPNGVPKHSGPGHRPRPERADEGEDASGRTSSSPAAKADTPAAMKKTLVIYLIEHGAVIDDTTTLVLSPPSGCRYAI